MYLDILWLVSFWSAVAILFYTYIGFPLLLAIRAFLFPRPITPGKETPKVSILIAAHNEAANIRGKLDNVYAQDYPKDRMEVVVASDGSDDETEQLVAEYPGHNLRLLELPRRGKNAALNSAAAVATGEIFVFTDADTTMPRSALRRLVAPFSAKQVGGVGGDFQYEKAGREVNGERTYWGFDRWLKWIQSLGGSMTSATGQIYAMRRELFRPIPPGVTDDFYESVQVVAAHKRLLFEPNAHGTGPITSSDHVEFFRKVRNITNGLSAVYIMRRLLNPFRYGFFALQLFSHKVLRRLMVFPLMVLLISSLLLWSHGSLYRWAAIAQVAFYASGWLYLLCPIRWTHARKLLSLAFFFQLVNAATLVSVWKLLNRRQQDIWMPHREPKTKSRVMEFPR